MQNKTLYYGDKLKILREYIPDNSIDLVYLDPPFNSKADYNILFRDTTGEGHRRRGSPLAKQYHNLLKDG